MDWTEDIDHVLNNIRINCILLNKAHKKRYFELKNRGSPISPIFSLENMFILLNSTLMF